MQNNIEIRSETVCNFLNNLPNMTLEAAHRTYHQDIISTEPKIEYFVCKQTDKDILEQFNLISTPQGSLDDTIAQMYLPDDLKTNKKYMQTPLKELLSQEKNLVQQKVKDLTKNLNDLPKKNHDSYAHLVLLHADILLLQRYCILFPGQHIKIGSGLNWRNGPYYRCKIKHNLQGLKTVLDILIQKSSLFILSEMIAFTSVLTLMSFGLQKYIKRNFCSLFISEEIIQKNRENQLFNECIKSLNQEITDMNILFPSELPINLLSKRPLHSEVIFSNYDILKMYSPSGVLAAFSFIWTLNYLSSDVNYKKKFTFFTLYRHVDIIAPVLALVNMMVPFFDLIYSHQLFDEYFSNSQRVISDIASIIFLYGAFVSIMVLINLHKTHLCRLECNEKEINKVLQKTGIEILN